MFRGNSLKELIKDEGHVFNEKISFPELPFPGCNISKPSIQMLPHPKRYKIMIRRATGKVKSSDFGKSLDVKKSYSVSFLTDSPS